MSSRKSTIELGTLGILAAAFVAVSYFAHANKETLAAILQSGSAISAIGFIALTMLFVIFVVPLDIIFLIPLGASVWGPIPTALMTITGWVLGSIVAFGIARAFGVPVVEKMIGLKRIQNIEARIPKDNLFWTVVLLRLVISVDILSYALGLFSTMPLGPYVLATLIGVAPFGFYFSYAGTLPFWYQISAVGGVVLLATVFLLLTRVRNSHHST